MKELLKMLDTAKVALIGDLCLDYYIFADMRLSELSRETPHFPLPVVSERYSAGGAANVACNVAALKPAKFSVIGLTGNDWRGDMLIRALKEGGCDTSLIVRSDEVTTNAYVKMIRKGISDVAYEDPRIDFENRKVISDELADQICSKLDMADFDVLLVSDQLKFGCITEKVREKICGIGASGKPVIVDSRDRIALYHNVIVKPNEIEVARGFGALSTMQLDPNSPDSIRAFAENIIPMIAERNRSNTIITLGSQGCLVYENGSAELCPANPVEPPVDIVGAGDTFLSACGTCVAAGMTLKQAARIANYASSVTVKKIGMTGTATRDEIIAAAEKN